MSCEGDYYLPCLKLPEEGQQPIGIWGQTVSERKPQSALSDLFTSGKPNGYPADIDRQAEEMFSRLVKQMVDAERITEKPKADDMMSWVGRMNGMRSRAAEIVNAS